MSDLPAGEVHVWLAPTDMARTVATFLDTQERAQAARFAGEPARNRYVTAHGFLRLVLGSYLGTEPAALCFRTAAMGKPELAGRSTLRFSLSHSGSLVAVAVAHCEVGVDVEQRRPLGRQHGVARRVLSAEELAAYEGLEDQARLDFLLDAWARKEAVLKAKGTGIREPLSRVSFHGWTVADLDVPGYSAAVAAAGRGWVPLVRRLETDPLPAG